MSFLNRLSFALPYHFWVVWAFGLLAAPAAALLMFWKGFVLPQPRLPGAEPTAGTTKPSVPVAVCFMVFLALYLGFMLWSEDFCYQDGHWFTDFSAIGRSDPPAIWQSVGRFWPLGYQEYNLIAHLSPTATAYLTFGAVQLVIGLWLLYRGMPPVPAALRVFTLVVLMLAPAFAADFAELTYADRNVAFAVCVLIFVVGRYDLRPTWSLLLAAVVVSYFALFYKETTVALFGGFAATRLALKVARSGLHAAWRSPLELGIVLACAYFALLLGLTLLPTGTSSYVHQISVGKLRATFQYLTCSPLLFAFLVTFCIHVVRTLRRGAQLDPLWDALGVGSVLHIGAVAVTGLAEVYLLGPSEIIATVTLVRLGWGWWQERPDIRPILAGIGTVLAAASMTFGTFRLLERKNIVWQSEKIASFVTQYYQQPGAQKTRLYLPMEGGVIMNFLSFLSARGLHFHSLHESSGVEAITVAGDWPYRGDLCVSYEDLVCRHDVARPGDLVVRLPEESWAPNDLGLRPGNEVLALHDAKLEPLFRSVPALLDSPLRPLIAALYRVGPTLNGVFRNRPLPDDWLSVSASKVVPAAAPTALRK